MTESFKRVVLCWQTLRPVPKVSIDFGNGHKLDRTLTGNTALYLCTRDGTVVDIWPGIYSADHFLADFTASMKFIADNNGTPTPEALAAWHTGRLKDALNDEQRRTSMCKAVVESPLRRALAIRDDTFAQPVEQHQAQVRAASPQPSQPLVKNPAKAFEALAAKIEDVSKRSASASDLRKLYERDGRKLSPEELGNLVVQIDSANNMRLMRPAIHLLISTWETSRLPEACKDDIFKKLLHTPIDDPYLGLSDALVPGTPPGK